MRALVFLVLLGVLNLWHEGTPSGDPFREGRTRILVMIMAGPLGMMLAHRVGILGLVWGWAVFVWAYWGMDSYGWWTLAAPPFFLLVGRDLVRRSQVGVWSALRWSFGIQAVLGILQAWHLIPDLFHDHWRPDGALGTIGQETLLGAFLAPLVPVAFFRWSALEAFTGLLCCFLCSSSMTLAALGGASVVALWKRFGTRPALGLIFVGISCLGLAWMGHRPDSELFSASGRIPVWQAAWIHIPVHPWIGWGPGSWYGLYATWGIEDRTIWGYLHSEPLQLLLELGWPAFALACFAFLVEILDAEADAATIITGLLVNSLGNFPFRVPVTGLLLCLALAMPRRIPRA